MYAVNMLYYHWLIKNLLWSMTGQSIGRWGKETECREKEGSVGQSPCNHQRNNLPALVSHNLEAIHRLIEMD